MPPIRLLRDIQFNMAKPKYMAPIVWIRSFTEAPSGKLMLSASSSGKKVSARPEAAKMIALDPRTILDVVSLGKGLIRFAL